MMKKTLIRILKISGIAILVLIVFLVFGTLVLNTPTVQHKLMKHSTALLSEKLETTVDIDKVNVNVFSQSLEMHNVVIEDLQHREMLKVGELDVKFEIIPLVTQKLVKIKSARLIGLKAFLLGEQGDEPANYQFLVEAIKEDKENAIDDHHEEPDTLKKPKKKLSFDVNNLFLQDIDLSYNDKKIVLGSLYYKKNFLEEATGQLSDLSFEWKQQTKKGLQDCRASIDRINYKGDKKQHTLDIDRLRFKTNNHLPRKNSGKPKRGAFDAGHLNILANAKMNIELIQPDSLIATITHLDAKDDDAGWLVKDINLHLNANKRHATLSDINIKLTETTLAIQKAEVQLPNKKENLPFTYTASPITGRVILRDIAKPFAPVLSKFDMPLMLNVELSGDSTSMDYQNITVATGDKRLTISSTGTLRHLKDKYALAIRFHVNKMTARNGVAKDIIELFPVKKFMMKQLQALGIIHYTGDFDVLWKKEQFRGLLNTDVGDLNFQFQLDEANKYLIGSASTSNVELGKAFDVKDLGKIVCTTDFRFDIHKGRTAEMRRKLGGKLPIGEVKANVKEAKYKKITVRNINADIKSNGAVAIGDIAIIGRHTDLLASFSFTNTDSIRSKLKVKPGIRFHGLTDEQKQEKAEKKRKKKEQKLLKKQQKEMEKERRKAEKTQGDNA